MGLGKAPYFQRLWNGCDDARKFVCRVLSLVMNAVMDEQAQLARGATRGERTEARTNSGNGYRPRTLKTATGYVELKIPKLREGSVVSSHAVVMAIRLGTDGRKHVLGVEAIGTESEEGWSGFLADFKARGLQASGSLSPTPMQDSWQP